MFQLPPSSKKQKTHTNSIPDPITKIYDYPPMSVDSPNGQPGVEFLGQSHGSNLMCHSAPTLENAEGEEAAEAQADTKARYAAQGLAAANAESERHRDPSVEGEDETGASDNEEETYSVYTPLPSFESTHSALKDIRAILKPPRNVTAPAKEYKDPGLNVTPLGLSCYHAPSCTYILSPCVPLDHSYQTMTSLFDLHII